MKRLHLRPSLYISVGLLLVVGLWLWSGQWSKEETAEGPANNALKITESPQEEIPSVRFVESRARSHRMTLTVNGQTDVNRSVIVRAETAGLITAVNMEESHFVKKGQHIADIAINNRRERVTEAEALLAQRQLEAEVAAKMVKKGFQSQVEYSRTITNLNAAKSALKAARIDLRNTNVLAPMDSWVERQSVEVGDYVQPGNEIAKLISLNPLLVKGQVSERDVGAVTIGASAEVKLVTNDTATGVVTRIAPVSESATRTFEVAVEVPNPEGQMRAGVTAEIKLPLNETKAHYLSPSLLTLNDEGEVGVRLIDDSGIARFTPITIVEDTRDGAWISGLPDFARIISVGQEYVRDGQKVSFVPDRGTS